MSNIAGKSYAMNVITPIRWYLVWVNQFIFWLGGTRFFKPKLIGLVTLSLIHYARWVVLKSTDFPHLDEHQPKEDLKYGYEFFFSNFNGSWSQYVDSFSSAIPGGLDLFWFQNLKYPKSVPFREFDEYITVNQIWTNHYYSAYPMASSNDIKSAKVVKDRLIEFTKNSASDSDQVFVQKYDRMLLALQHHLAQMGPSPIVSLANQAIAERQRILDQ